MRRPRAAGAATCICMVLIGAQALAPSASGADAEGWPFIRTSCPEAVGEPMHLVALGTSKTAGWGIRSEEPYSPQQAHPARYADLLCEELARPVELHSYFPDQLGNELAFATIGEPVPDSATVLAVDAYVIPFIIDRWAADPSFEEIRQLIDPHFMVERLAPEHGFTFVATEAPFNGADASEPPAAGLFQADGLHPTAAGAQLAADVIAQQDGLGV